LYVDLRIAMFHAKTGWIPRTPQAWTTRSTAIDARVRYACMFRRLAEEYLGVRYPNGALDLGLSDNAPEQLTHAHVVFVSDGRREHGRQQQDESRFDGFVQLPTKHASDGDIELVGAVEGIASAETIRSQIGDIRGFGTLVDDEVATIEYLRAQLVLGEDTELSIVVVVEGRDDTEPRQEFET
jgi:hypothetical protein